MSSARALKRRKVGKGGASAAVLAKKEDRRTSEGRRRNEHKDRRQRSRSPQQNRQQPKESESPAVHEDGEEESSSDELIGFVREGELYLAGARSGVVFSSVERDDADELVRLGHLGADPPAGRTWDAGSLAAENPQVPIIWDSQQLSAPVKDEALPQGLRPERRTLPFGRYFPKAVKIPGATVPDKCSILLFYQYAEPLWSEVQKEEAMTYVERLGVELNLGGRVRISREGFNSTLSGARLDLNLFCERLRTWRPANFSQTDFKFLDDLPPDKAFKDLDIFPVQEIVHYGLPPDVADRVSNLKGEHLSPEEYHKKMQQKGTVIIDVRNSYETAIGRFSPPDGGAEWIDPLMRRSTDFQQFLEDDGTREKLKNKEVLMYCTGGVRCERASAMLKYKFGNEVRGVFQLHGGIEKYLKQFHEEGSGFWRGKNFTFDKRNANSAGEMFEDPYTGSSDKPLSSARCCVCEKFCDRYVGHRKCGDCGVPVIVCDDCLSTRRDKTSGLRCPLCAMEFHYLAENEGALARQVATSEGI